MYSIATFSGMPDVRRKSLKGPIVGNSPNQFMVMLRKYRTVSAAGDHGSAMVYIDDAGQFRCSFHRYGQTIDSPTFKFKKHVKEWLIAWLPHMERPHPNGERT
jgi:hypothetical protein